jgi:hypothetical protein
MKVRLIQGVSAYLLLLAGVSSLWAQVTTPQSSVNPATHFLVTAPSAVTLGTVFKFTVKARDASNNLVTSYSGTVHFTSTDKKAVLPANSKLSSGTGTFSAKLETAGMHTIRVTDTLTSSITGISTEIRVNVVTSISIAPQNLKIFLHSSQPFDAVATFSDGSVQDVTKTVQWFSSEPTTASVSTTGVVTGLEAGSASISAEIGLIKSSTSVTVSSSNSGVTLVDDFTDSHLMRYQSADGSLVTYAGARNRNGLAAAITSALATTSDGKTQEITFDGEGRISQVNTSDGSQLSINWSSPSKPILTAISADRTQIAAVVIPKNSNASAEASASNIAKQPPRNNAEPVDSSSSALQTVRVSSCNATTPEDGALVYVAKSGFLGGSPVPANLLGAGVYGVYLPSGPTGEASLQLSQPLEDLVSNICTSDPTAPTISLAACALLPPPFDAVCIAAVGAYKAMCAARSAINGADAVANYLNNKSLSVDVIADVTLNGHTDRQTLSNQSPLGPYRPFEFDFPCLQIAHVNVSPSSATIDVGQPLPLEATAVDENSHIITSSALRWTWSPSDEFVQIVSNGSSNASGLATVTGKEQTAAGIPDTVTATAAYSGQGSKIGSSEISVGCSASGMFQGTYSGSDGSSGSVTASLTQNGKSIAGTVSIVESDGEEFGSNVTGTDDNGTVSFGPIAFGDLEISATGTFSSNCGTLSGNFLLQGTDTIVGTYTATKQ